jgi:protease-4
MGTIVYGAPEVSEGTVPQNEMFVDADRLAQTLRSAESDPTLHGVIVQVDSPGGSPVASAHLYETLKRMQKPVVAYIREVGTSGGYMAALGADKIVAHPVSVVGSIGVTQSFTTQARKNEKEGIDFVELATGAYKEVGNPNKVFTEADRKSVMDELEDTHDFFVGIVKTARGMTDDAVRKIATGDAWSGVDALGLGLVDTTGVSIYDAHKEVEKLTGKSEVLCE